MNENLKPSQKIVDFIKDFEKFSAVAYFATEHEKKKGIRTIGYGHVIKEGEVFGRITEAEATQILLKDITAHIGGIYSKIKVKLTQHQFDALVSFHFNAGANALDVYFGLRDAINAGNFKAAADRFLRYNTQNGVVLNGLTKRRTSERNIFLNADYRRIQ